MTGSRAFPVVQSLMARLLIIDDEPALLEMLTRICRDAGFEVCGHATVAEGLEALHAWQPDLVLVDYRIGLDSGMYMLEVCQREFPTLPTVMITAERSPEVVIQALRLGVNDFLLKPVAPAELVAALQRCLHLHRPAAAPGPAPAAAATCQASNLPVGGKLADFLRAKERRFIQASLEYNGGSREKTAAMLGVSLATLYRKMGSSQGRRQRA
jgi:DNA-binding NtrC family response regulator